MSGAALGDHAGLISCFACGASLFGKAAKYKAVLKRTGTAARDAISIGDEVRDGEAARQAGIDFGAVSWGYASVEALRQAGPVLVPQRARQASKNIEKRAHAKENVPLQHSCCLASGPYPVTDLASSGLAAVGD